jgi:Domain of unknown function (DUF4440)
MGSDKEILALEDKRYAAMCGGDFAALEAMLHDELLYTHSSGLTDTKATWLASSPDVRVRIRRFGGLSRPRAVVQYSAHKEKAPSR